MDWSVQIDCEKQINDFDLKYVYRRLFNRQFPDRIDDPSFNQDYSPLLNSLQIEKKTISWKRELYSDKVTNHNVHLFPNENAIIRKEQPAVCCGEESDRPNQLALCPFIKNDNYTFKLHEPKEKSHHNNANIFLKYAQEDKEFVNDKHNESFSSDSWYKIDDWSKFSHVTAKQKNDVGYSTDNEEFSTTIEVFGSETLGEPELKEDENDLKEDENDLKEDEDDLKEFEKEEEDIVEEEEEDDEEYFTTFELPFYNSPKKPVLNEVSNSIEKLSTSTLTGFIIQSSNENFISSDSSSTLEIKKNLRNSFNKLEPEKGDHYIIEKEKDDSEREDSEKRESKLKRNSSPMILKQLNGATSFSDILKTLGKKYETIVIPAAFEAQFKNFAKIGNSKKTGLVITKKCSNFWFKQSGLLGYNLRLFEVDACFTEIARKKVVLTIHDYLIFLTHLSLKKKLELQSLIDGLSKSGGINGKRSHCTLAETCPIKSVSGEDKQSKLLSRISKSEIIKVGSF